MILGVLYSLNDDLSIPTPHLRDRSDEARFHP